MQSSSIELKSVHGGLVSKTDTQSDPQVGGSLLCKISSCGRDVRARDKKIGKRGWRRNWGNLYSYLYEFIIY